MSLGTCADSKDPHRRDPQCQDWQPLGLTRDAAEATAFKLAAEKLAEDNTRLRETVARLRWALGQVTDEDGCSAEDLAYARRLVVDPNARDHRREHDSLCESEFVAEAGAYTPCQCAERLDKARQSEAAADAAMEAEQDA